MYLRFIQQEWLSTVFQEATVSVHMTAKDFGRLSATVEGGCAQTPTWPSIARTTNMIKESWLREMSS